MRIIKIEEGYQVETSLGVYPLIVSSMEEALNLSSELQEIEMSDEEIRLKFLLTEKRKVKF